MNAKIKSKRSIHFLCVQLTSPLWLWMLSSDVHGVALDCVRVVSFLQLNYGLPYFFVAE